MTHPTRPRPNHPGAGSAVPQVDLISRDGCHLCEIAEDDVARVCKEAHVDWRRLDVDADPDLKARYRDHVPVLIVNERIIDYWHVDPDRLAAVLRGEEVSPRPIL